MDVNINVLKVRLPTKIVCGILKIFVKAKMNAKRN